MYQALFFAFSLKKKNKTKTPDRRLRNRLRHGCISGHNSEVLHQALPLLRSTAENGGKYLEENIEKYLPGCLNFGCLREENSSSKMRRGPGGVGAINRQRLARVNTTLTYMPTPEI